MLIQRPPQYKLLHPRPINRLGPIPQYLQRINDLVNTNRTRRIANPIEPCIFSIGFGNAEEPVMFVDDDTREELGKVIFRIVYPSVIRPFDIIPLSQSH